jgi:hypothetical protein
MNWTTGPVSYRGEPVPQITVAPNIACTRRHLATREAPLVMRCRWTDGRNQENQITRTTKKTHLAAPPIGVVSITKAFVSREPPLSDGGALPGRCFGRRRRRGARAVGETKFRNRSLGLSDHVGVQFARRGTLAQRRVSRVGREASGAVDGSGCSTLAPSFARACG